MKKNIIITGSSGVLGKYLVNQFKKGNNIISISRNKVSRNGIINYCCNLSRDLEVNSAFSLIKKKFKKIDLIILCAGKSKKILKN